MVSELVNAALGTPTRPRRRRVLIAGLAWLAGAGAGCGPERMLDPTLPGTNLVVVSIDTLRADHLGCYGYARDTSPRIDAFAARGTLFRRAVSASSWTLPAHASMLTGLEPPAHGLVAYPSFETLAEEHRTLAEILRERGYHTAAFTGGGWMSEKTGIDAGFDSFASDGKHFEDTWPRLERWLAERAPEDAFFLLWHGFNVHKPYQPPAPYDRRFCGDCKSDYDTKRLQPDAPRPSPADLAHAISQYDGEIAYVDELFGKLMDRLEAQGLLAKTVVIVVSDHGDEFYEHGMVDHIHTLYDELLRVPWIVAGPGVPAAVVEAPVSTVDLLPTALALLGVGVDHAIQGRSRVSEMERAAAGTAASASEADSATFAFTGFANYPYHLASVRTPAWKLVVWKLAGMRGVDLDADPDRALYTYKFRRDRAEDFVELFDLAADPGEQRDRAAERPEVVAELSRALERRLAESRALSRAPAAAEIDAQYVEELKALGYLQ
jgi:arylsulfatase A-like enzyme